ncbi:MAG: RnfABCDGE type electron transport complex subunit C [Catenisphaera adipataccumulans]|jgi:electron transport complex protein RnfC|uniref:RnfABCDGE type electron transport complex subunit C n=1 Tax=Catenisphaera adipataccumulans TaxID=700500 RepID=UPI003D93080F
MSLFLGSMSHHIPGRKELTDSKAVVRLLPKKEAYIPLVAGRAAGQNSFNILVEEGEAVQVGTKLAETKSGMYVPIYSSVSGTYKGIVKRMHSTLRPQEHMVIECDGKQTSVQAFEPLDYKNATREECVDFVKNAGIVGLGGAGFPTYVKYGKPDGVECVLINAVECEPYITADYRNVMDDPTDLIIGADIMKKMADVQHVYICIKESHPDLIAKVKENLGGYQGIEVRPVPDVYPMGWERVLVREVLHREYNNLPAEAGAIVGNASSAIAIAKAFTKGEPIHEKTVTVSGNAVKNPQNVVVPVGTPVSEIMEACGGYTAETVRLIAGGPMMGRTIVNDLFVVDRATNAITVLEDVADDAIACLRCGRCSDHCPSGLQPVRIKEAVQKNDLDEMIKRGASSCIECGMCTYICPSHIDVTEHVRKAKRVIAMKKK